jgi:hypothetical protein
MATKINVRSPFFIKATPSSGTISKAVLSLFVYDGIFTTNKGSAVYTVEKTPLTGNNFVVFEISELVRDYLDIEFSGDYESTSSPEIDPVRWVEADIVITKTDASTENANSDYVAFDGYGYFEEGVNPELSRTLLQSNKTIFRVDDFNTRVPVFTEDTSSVSFLNNNEVVRTVAISSSTNTNAQVKYVDVFGNDQLDTYKERVLADGGTFEDNTLLDDFLDSIDAGEVDEVYINSASGTEVLKVKTFSCSKYEPVKITFVNKFGVLQDLFFTLKSVESTDVTSQNYKRSIFSESTLSYKTYQHQKQLFQTNGNDRIVLNTDYLNDDNNQVIEELMLSEQHWMTRITDVQELIIPVIPRTKSVTYKTSVNDRLTQYTIEFDMAFDKINNIR